MITANNYMFRSLTGHHQVVHPMKMGLGALQYTMKLLSRRQTEVTLYIVQPPTPFSLAVQPYDGLLEAETCSC
jgi:hypothetical protein